MLKDEDDDEELAIVRALELLHLLGLRRAFSIGLSCTGLLPGARALLEARVLPSVATLWRVLIPASIRPSDLTSHSASASSS